MQDTEIVEEVAQLDGWIFYPSKDNGFGQARPEFWQNEETGETVWENQPKFKDYLTSRDAIVPVIEKQPYEIKCQIGVELAKMDGWKGANLDEVSNFDWDDIILLVTKPARQLSEALLRSVGRWKD